jgi:ribose transport system substrate-binding protein
MAATFFPIGPTVTTLEPQVPGLTATAASLPAADAALQAQAVVKFCAKKNPCTVVILIGFPTTPFDAARLASYRKVLDPHKNIKVIATETGQYSETVSDQAVAAVLARNPHFNVLLSNADQQVEGADIAFRAAGWNLKQLISSNQLYIMGAGADQAAISQIRAGTWSATLANYPHTMGELSLQQIVNALRGKPYKKILNLDTYFPALFHVPQILTAKALKKVPNFIGEWVG